MKKVLPCLLLLILTGCTSESTARKTLENIGYQNIQMTGYKPFACAGEEYSFSTGFTADLQTFTGKRLADGNPEIVVKHVSGAVCSGFFTNDSVKFD